ncbi:DNA-binding/iron metalloprotein/AP endonuclease [Spiroplasma clarkii]|uniref:tRNA N6-adenosine threonylcarbamoyltransferase n=1 Tax=Spiroplasma clarkii TaxID=2139 RepID=A0A1Y0L2M1_9MOLU|nr:tRNA (adenosine(37)-N6)-threonylcarbamoyltransferase complex transferase subunit TsaD [Spiroplasma clarkii]ARU92274.1 DNA-binding/iron metalloprotein/AP endonuclease [Spiroplasma clarkii]ATX71586.1 DNA-binding/iron metalloprotein/AP endonuclease [Spiroplasma clarkii]
MKILAIESSCDEFSVAIIVEGVLRANIVSSQVDEHKEYGGVIPEFAARLHVKNFAWVLQEALTTAALEIDAIEMIAYTAYPGLIGSLIVGKLVAQTLAMYLNAPLMPLDHIQGHIYAAKIENNFDYPVISLVVSGGHTQIQLLKKPLEFEILGTTQDDAVGECYDKVARALGLTYPGGPKIDKLATQGDPNKYKLPLVLQDGSYNFSFSGLKTACLNLINKHNQNQEKINLADFCASFQTTAIKNLLIKLEKAVANFQPKTLSLAGGVSANKQLRETIKKFAKLHHLTVALPSLQYCTDNAAMMAQLAQEYLQRREN